MASITETQRSIMEVCDGIKELLLEKNKRYGNSATEPKRVFSKASAEEQILVRIDDKLSRIATTGFQDSHEDTLQDLIGYLILLKVHRGLEDKKFLDRPMSGPRMHPANDN
jgi:hypothetical protein